jgi:protoporphyrin/coproporphyrin ferrochelatase
MKTAVLLVNLGTPDSSSTGDVKKYLTEFLNDPRVIDLPWLKRSLLVNLLIVPFRSSRSAKLYQKIWTPEGSPLLVYSKQVKEKLQTLLGDKFVVELAMRYQTPSIDQALETFHNEKLKKIIVLPLFPQYASASTGSVHEKIMKLIGKWQVLPPIAFINSYCNHSAFINAWEAVAKKYTLQNYDHILFSFHGLPERQISKADISGNCLKENCCDSLNKHNYYCYRAQCYETARQITAKLGISKENYTVCFQSRLGKDPWIKPYTDVVLKELAASGKKKLLAFAPAFVSDCLETIYEIGVEYDEAFRSYGGEKVQLVESLNADPAWISALKTMVLEN